MTISFNGQARTITLDTPGLISVRDIWSRYVDWLAEGDNSKHFPMLDTVGLDTSDIPFYLFLADDVTMVSLDTSVPTIIYDGVLKTYDDRDPFGGAVVNVRYQAPGIALGYSTGEGGGSDASLIVETLCADPRFKQLLTLANFLALKD